MEITNNCRLVPLALVAVIAMQPVWAAGKAPASSATVVLQRIPVPGTDREMGMGLSELPPNGAKPRHKASGPEVCYVLEGDVTVQMEGKPAKLFHAGEAFQIPADVMYVMTAGRAGAKIIASWVHVPGQPFSVPGRD